MINRDTCVLHRIVELWKKSVYFKIRQRQWDFQGTKCKKEQNYQNKITVQFYKNLIYLDKSS